MIMIGYSTSGYRLFDIEINSVVNARNVVFDEMLKDQMVYLPTGSAETSTQNKRTEQETYGRKEQRTEKQNSEIGNKEDQEQTEDVEEQLDPNTKVQEKGRGKRLIQKPKWHEDYEINIDEESEQSLFALMTSQEDVSLNYQEIEERNDKEDWKEAVGQELKILKASQTWKIVSKPEKEKLLDSKWVFIKKNIGNKKICKAGLVVRGFQQKEYLGDTYSPVLKLQTLRVLLSVAACREHHIHQMDVTGAFLYK